MRISTRRLAQILLFAVCAITVTTHLIYAEAPRLVWEGEQVRNLSGKAFKITKLTGDPAGPVSGKQTISLDKVPQGQKVAADAVTYDVKIPSDGTYYLWARTRWTTGCGNSFFISCSAIKGEPMMLGGDGTYNSMHWIQHKDAGRPYAFKLKKGTVTFTLGSREGGVYLDQFLLTTDAKFKPAGIYTATPDLLAK